MSNVWTEDDTEKLITLYGQYQCLWNSFHPEFNNKLSRYKAYKEIKSSMNINGLTICDYIQRITNTKKKYCYELSKIAAAIFCEKLYTPKAKWFERMHVLLFPRVSISHYNNFRKQDNKIIVERQNTNKSHNNDARDDALHSSIEISNKQNCSNDTCNPNESSQIELCLTLRNSIHSDPTLHDAYILSEPANVVTNKNNGTAEREIQTDTLHERDVNEGKKDETAVDDISVEVQGKKKLEDNFDIFGKSVAFQLRTIDIRTAVQLEREIQNLLTKARLKTLECKLVNQNVAATCCCCDCNNCKMCNDETCGCGLTLKECLLLTSKIKKSKEFCYK